jgi:DNA-binding transcriptional ArsR family regulator
MRRVKALAVRDELVQQSLLRFEADVFRALAHPTRMAIVELLREEELSVTEILVRLKLEQANVSQHLAILRSKRIATSRRERNQVFYSLRDPMLVKILDMIRCYFEADLAGATAVLGGLAREGLV